MLKNMKQVKREFNSNMMVNGARLMDKGTLGKKQAKVNLHWSHTRDHAMVTAGDTGYMTRLTALRDSLVEQEQVYLASAVERLRAHSLSNKATSRRLRMTGYDINKSPIQLPMNNLMTTAEKFRQMRPKEEKTVILPLLGTQIFVRNSTKVEKNSECANLTERSNNTSKTGCDVVGTSLPSISEVDGVVKRNLQRIKDTPRGTHAVGQNSGMDQEHHEQKIKSPQILRPRLDRQNGRRLVSLLLPFNNPEPLSLSQLSLDMTQHFSNHESHVPTPKYPHPVSWDRKINFTNDDQETENMEENYYEFFDDCIRPECQKMERNCVHNEKYEKQRCNGCYFLQKSCKKFWHHRRQTVEHHGQASLKDLQQLEAVIISGKINYGYKNGGKITETDEDSNKTESGISENSHSNMYNSYQIQNASIQDERLSNQGSGDYILTSNSKETLTTDIPRTGNVINSIYYSHQRRSRNLPVTSNSGSNISLTIVPLVLQNMAEPRTKNHDDYTEASSNGNTLGNRKHIVVNIPRVDTQEIMKHSEDIQLDVSQTCIQENRTQTNNSNEDMSQSDAQENREQKKQNTDTQENRTHKKHTIVDVPNTLFNASSPVPQQFAYNAMADNSENEIHNQRTCESSSGTKSMQQEIRLRELANLLEDVKDLSTKPETLKLIPTTEIVLQQDSF